jgi:hypothetical protein
MQLAAILLSLAALGGITMVVIRLKGAPLPPTALAVVHGLIAACGVAALAYAAYDPGVPQLAQIALGIFVLAALGGLTLFLLFHRQGRPLPVPLMLGHGLIALAGLGLFLYTLYGGAGPAP